MKKSIITVAVLLLLAALLPILGNSFMKQTIDERIIELQQYGLEANKDESQSSYLNSSRHIEFTLKNSRKFLEYLKSFSNKQSPAYVNAMFNGVVLGVDIEYSNLPFAKAFEIEIYPLTLSDKIRESLSQNDAAFLTYLQKFLQTKGIIYHIDYNIINDKFDGNIKDINQKYTLKDGTKVDFKLSKAIFKGEGSLVSPDMMDSKIKTFHINLVQKTKTFDIGLENFSSSMSFDSKSTYESALAVEKIDVFLNGTSDDKDIHAKKIKFNISSNTQSTDAKLNAMSSFDVINMVSKDLNLTLKKFDFDIAVNGIDKNSYAKLAKLLGDEKNQQSPLSNNEVRETLIKLFSKGFAIDINKFGLENISLNEDKQLNGFDFNLDLKFKADKDLAEKIKLYPLMAGSNLEFKSTLKIALELYTYLAAKSPMFEKIRDYAKEEKGSYVFEMNVQGAKATLNGKPLN